MGWAKYFVLILTIAWSMAMPTPLIAYPTPVDFDGKLSRWDIHIDAEPITFEVVGDDPDDIMTYDPAVDEAAGIWSDVPSSYFNYGRVLEGEKADVTVHLQRALEGGDFSAGYAVFDEMGTRGPKHCSIYVSVGHGEAYSSVAKTLLHELGHCVGLGHSVIPQAIMSYELDKNSFGLDIDDEAGISRLYPADGSTPKLPPGCAMGSFEKKSAHSKWTLFGLGFLLALPLVFVSRSPTSGRSPISPAQ